MRHDAVAYIAYTNMLMKKRGYKVAKLDEFNRGNLAAYIELLKVGIRNMCLPNASAYKRSYVDYVDKEAMNNGFYTLLVTFNRSKPNGQKFKSYQRIVYRPGRRAYAERLRKRLQKTPKSRSDHVAIGKLLGYRSDAIALFINEKPQKDIYK